MEPQTLTQPQGQTPGSNQQPIDPTALNLSRAIRKVENTGYDQTVSEPNGSYSHGAYGWNGDNFQNWAKQYGLNPEDTSETNQDHLAYLRIKDMLDQGSSQSEIAARWNGSKMVNGKYVAINPDYVNNVKTEYEKLISNPSQNQSQGQPELSPGVPALSISKPDPNQQNDQTQLGQESSLGQQISQRGKDLGGALNIAGQGLSDVTKGNVVPGLGHIASGAIQGAGAFAGAAGDLVNKGLEQIPGFKGIENLIGKGIGALAQTPAGQSVAKAVNDFSTANPEIAKDIGAGFNIATAIPIFKGLGALKNVAMDGVSIALKNVAEKGAIKDLTEVAGRTVGGRGVLSSVPKAVENMVKERAMPEIVGGRYVTEGGMQKLNSIISEIDKNELQPILDKVSGNQNFGQSLSTLKKLAIKEAENDTQLKEAGLVPQAIKQIDKRFEGWKYSYGDNVDLGTQNRIKIGSGKFSDWGTPEGSADKSIYRALQKNIELLAKKNGLGDVHAINQRMGNLLDTRDLFQYLNGKAVKNSGVIHGLINAAATAGGEVAGNAVGLPIAGTVVGNRSAGLIEKTLGGFSPRAVRNNILERTTQGAKRQTLKGLVGSTAKMAAGSIAAKANR